MKQNNKKSANGERENRLNVLLDQIQQQRMQPEDKYEVAAIIESFGWNDRLVAQAFGAGNVFELSEILWDSLKARVVCSPIAQITKMGFWHYLKLIIGGFLRGTIFALPMAVSVVAMLTLRLSLWSYVNFSLENATSIAVGTILSFVAVGGFMQAIAHWGFRLLGMEQYYMARKLVFYYVKIGYVICFLIAVAFLIFNFVFVVFPWQMAFIVAIYFLFLSVIWLSTTIMYILQKELTFTGLIIGGIALVYIFFQVLHFGIIISQVIALSLVSVVGVLLARYFFLQAEKQMEKGINPPLPRLSLVLNISLPFFSYGFLYFLFLFIDRVVAWSTNNIYMPFLIWFRGEYELGLDLALIVLILPMGLVEAVVTEMMVNLEGHQKKYMMYEIPDLNNMYKRMYLRRLAYVTLFSALNAVGLYLLIEALNKHGIFESVLFFGGTTRFVFIWAVIAYAIVAVALLNALILFFLARPKMAYRGVLLGLAVDLGLGFLLSRWVDYYWAVFGLLAGALVFAVVSSRQVLKVLNNLDYYLYSVS